MTFTQTLKHNLLDFPGWHTKRHIVVFESDDRGSIKIPSFEVFRFLKEQGMLFLVRMVMILMIF